jgi:hypothetical protein
MTFLQFVILHYRENDGSLSEKCRQAQRGLNRPLLYRIATQHLLPFFSFPLLPQFAATHIRLDLTVFFH